MNSPLNDYGLRVNENKFKFFENRIDYCGHEIDRNGLRKTKSKIDAVLNCKQPANVTEVRSFWGLVNYYHRFLLNLATTLHPLYELLKSGSSYTWTTHCKQAFKKFKENFVSEMFWFTMIFIFYLIWLVLRRKLVWGQYICMLCLMEPSPSLLLHLEIRIKPK